MKDIRIALVGTGFGKRVMLPAFAACPGGKVVAVCSGQRASRNRSECGGLTSS